MVHRVCTYIKNTIFEVVIFLCIAASTNLLSKSYIPLAQSQCVLVSEINHGLRHNVKRLTN